MFEWFFRFLELSGEFLGTQILIVLAYPFIPGQRIFWLYLVTSLLFALYVYRISARTTPDNGPSVRAFCRFLFPKHIWSNPSAWLDVRYFFFHQIVRLVIYGVFVAVITNTVFKLITGGPSLLETSPLTLSSSLTDMAIATGYMLVAIVCGDFLAYAIHYAQHRIPILWEFHRVHHSLEVMHPLSNYREHPVDNIAYAASVGLVYGLTTGLSSTLFGYVPSMPHLLGVPLLMFAFNILGYNLRHSHIWLRWPGRWSMAFASPAHHQVHHSCHPDHIDKNFAFILPIWDVLFGTYQMPETNKDVRFGLSPGEVNDYRSCLGLYFIPFRNLWRQSTRRSVPPTKAPAGRV